MTAGPRHLWDLKQAIYDHPYENDVSPAFVEGFEHISREKVRHELKLCSNGEIKDLFSMTPYFWRTPFQLAARLDALERLDTEIDFTLDIHRPL